MSSAECRVVTGVECSLSVESWPRIGRGRPRAHAFILSNS